VVILTTEPEIPDVPYLPQVLEKVRRGRMMDGMEGVEWVVDGGVDAENAREAVSVGADTLVVGRAAFHNGEIVANLGKLRVALTETQV
jgi:pentose-5-phosphate-3-epimerase